MSEECSMQMILLKNHVHEMVSSTKHRKAATRSRPSGINRGGLNQPQMSAE